MLRRIGLAGIALFLALPCASLAEQPPPCADDPTRTIFAGVGRGPCKKFHGDQATCEAAYYVNRRDEAVSCGYVEGTCVGCGGENLVCPTNTCNGRANGISPVSCEGDPGRTAFLGEGDNDSRRCRNLDHTDQATCENAFYDDQGDNRPVACAWFPGDGSCRGCGDNGNHCLANACATVSVLPDVTCTEDPTRTNLLGFGGDGGGACRRLDATDQATCENSFYSYEQSGFPVACWWDGDDCRGSGFTSQRGFTSHNACLSSVASTPSLVGTCAADPGRATLLGLGTNNNGTCHQLDHTDEATCEDAFYLDRSSTGVACWWDGAHCRGSYRRHFRENACRGPVIVGTAVCADGRPNLLGFGQVGGGEEGICRSFDGTDQATCESGYYQSAKTGIAVGCFWDAGNCRGCSGRNGVCPANACVNPECAEDSSHDNFIGFGGNQRGQGQNGGSCRQFTDEMACLESFYFSQVSGRGVGCWWDGGVCRGSSRNFIAEDPCRDNTPVQCGERPTLVGFGANGSQACRQLDGMQEECEGAYYESLSGEPVACWWQNGICAGSHNRNLLLNACLRTPPTPSATCADMTRTMLIGFGATGTGQMGGACNALTPAGEATCNMAYYQSLRTGGVAACWWDEGTCRGSSNGNSSRNTCVDFSVPCPLDMRNTFLGLGSDNQQGCSGLGDMAACEDAYYLSSRTFAPSACWWDGDDCHGTSRRYFAFNECYVDSAPPVADVSCNTSGQARPMLLGFGNFDGSSRGTRACRVLSSMGQEVCESAYYQSIASGLAVSCWWDESECRGSGRSNSDENVCQPEGVCPREDRSMLLGFGNNNSSPCRGIEDMGQEVCEDAFYLNDGNLEAVACWWDVEFSECRGSNNAFDRLNACLHTPRPPTAACGDRSMPLGIGDNNSGRPGFACRRLDGTDLSTCEAGFYEDDDDYTPVACVWAEGANVCLGTNRVPSLNACVSPELPVCEGNPGRTLFIGRGEKDVGQSGGACRQFADEQESCDLAFYLDLGGEPVACSWVDAGDGFGECFGTNRPDQGRVNECQPTAPCDDMRSISLGVRDGNTCRQLSSAGQSVCEDAYYIHPTGDFTVGCYWDGDDCVGCGGNFGGRSPCPENLCSSATVTCAGDLERTEVHRCLDVSEQLECESSFHTTGRSLDGVLPFAASCAWDPLENRCFGCGLPSQSSRECTNTCVVGCGNGIVEPDEQCDDGNMFNGDCCDENCQLEPNGDPCTDRLFCTEGAGSCQDGECVGAPARICASCIAGDCFENLNFCENEGFGGERGVVGGAAQLQGIPPQGMPEPEGTICDDGLDSTAASACDANGMCVEAEGDPTATPTATPTSTPGPAPVIVPAPVPALGEWGYAIALLGLFALALVSLRRRGARD